MATKRKLRNVRPKALFGEAAAIAAQTIAQVASAAMQAKATADAARTNADATLANAKSQADAMQKQNENNTTLQNEMMSFTKAQNDESRQIQKDLQMNMQLAQGALSSRDRREASKLIVKYGGKTGGRRKRRLMDAQYPLQGGYNLPFQVTDGGGVIPIGQTPEGYDVYEIYGNDHKHYHRSRGGKYKSGVGFRFMDGTEIEGEGNQNSRNGEIMVNMPNDAIFLSKHTIGGFNPAEAVRNGMHPLTAYNIQENNKRMYGMDYNFAYISPVENNMYMALGGNASYNPLAYNDMINLYNGGMNASMLPSIVPVDKRTMKNGGSTKAKLESFKRRNKAALGWAFAPSLGAAGNVLGAGISNWLINGAYKGLNQNIGQAGDILARAYENLQGVDMNTVFGSNAKAKASFNMGHYMPVVRSTKINDNPQIARIDSDNRRQLRSIINNTGSSAAVLNRQANANAMAADRRSQVYADTANREEQIKQANNQAINEAGAHNAQIDIEGLRNYMGTIADIAKFNANVRNESILGAAQARADSLMSQGQTRATAKQSIGNAWASALSQSGLGFGNAANAKLTRDADIAKAMLSSTSSGRDTYMATMANAKDADAYIVGLAKQANIETDPTVRTELVRRLNKVLTARGSEPVNENELGAWLTTHTE